ncbi:MAG: RDD family protein [Acidobacteriota bacterium]
MADWRNQLSLELDRFRTRKSEAAEMPVPETTADKELVRPQRRNEAGDARLNAESSYHPLAEKVLEKLDRIRAVDSSSPAGASSTGASPSVGDVPLAPVRSSVRRARKSGQRSDRIERIEIELNQPTLPFDAQQSGMAESGKQLQDGLTAAPVSARVRAGSFDSVFVVSSLLLFLMIVFFIPDFAFFSKSALAGIAVITALLTGSYLLIFTFLSGKTLGMDYLHLRVVNFEGAPPTFKEACLRSFGYLVSLGCFGMGFLWACFDPEKLTWHDRMSRTLITPEAS